MQKISVIIATYNRCESLKDTLESIVVQELNNSFDFEVLVVDNNSKDQTKATIENYSDKFNGRLKYLFEPKQGKSYALNLAIKEAKGEILAFTDDDCIVSKDWLKNINIDFNKFMPDIIGGKVLLNDSKLPNWFSDDIKKVLNYFDRGNELIFNDTNHDMNIGTGSNIIYAKGIFNKFGLFNTNLGPKGNKYDMGEDTEMYRRSRNSGAKTIYSPNIIVYHKVHKSKLRKGYVRKWFISWGKWSYILDQKKINRSLKSVFGIPRWRYSKFMLDMKDFIKSTISRNQAKAFYKELCLLSFLGYCMKLVTSLVSEKLWRR